ncbi:hypothetical protein NESM_000045100 [Novymonas esmeraldas]|uniref:Uncharacterized protein n=1 Tax=Novymonas esmeraldas TaxID=1808958 RepID=A0AAW0F271_9TRYP
MQDWQIAVLVVIVVVFVALATLLLFLIYKFGNCNRLRLGRKSNIAASRYADATDAFSRLYRDDPRIHPSAHLLYFLDFQGELHWIDFKRRPASKIRTEAALQHHIVDVFQPTVEDGNRVLSFAPEMIGLSYVNEQHALVVLDVNRLLARDSDFGARMLHTAERPLLLSRLVADGVDGVVYTVLSRYNYNGAGGAAVSPVSRTATAFPAAPGLGQQLVEVDLSRSRANPMSFAPSVPPALPYAPAPPPVFRSPVAAALPPPSTSHHTYAADVPGMAPTPVVHPCETHHITTSTLVSVSAATYTVLHSNGGRTELDAVNTARVEAARLRWDRRQSLVVPLASGVLAGYQCLLDPVSEAATLVATSAIPGASASSAEPVVCQRADLLHYTVERVNSTQWLPYSGPFCLPAGRWCVRARAVLFRDDSSKTVAKVFTVNVL